MNLYAPCGGDELCQLHGDLTQHTGMLSSGLARDGVC